MKIRNALTIMMIFIFLSGCTTTREEVKRLHTSSEYFPFSLKLKVNDFNIKHGIVTIRPELIGQYQTYKFIRKKKIETSRTVNAAGYLRYPFILLATVIALPYLLLFGDEDASDISAGDAIVDTITLSDPAMCYAETDCDVHELENKVIKEKGTPEEKTISFRNGEVFLEIKGSNQRVISVPLYKDRLVKFALRELGNSHHYTIAPKFYGSLAHLNRAEIHPLQYDVPQSYMMIEKQTKNNWLLVGSFSNDILETLAEQWQFKVNQKHRLNQTINEVVRKNVKSYLSVVEKPVLPKPLIIPKIKKPDIPVFKPLVKKKFESTQAFEQHYAKAQRQQFEKIHQLEKQYKNKVRQRNKQVEQENHFIRSTSERLLRNYRRRLESLQETLDEEQKSQVVFAYMYLLSSPELKNIDYDIDHQTLYGVISTSYAGKETEYPVKSAIPPALAKNIYEHSQTNPVYAKLKYYLRPDYSLKLTASSFDFRGKKYPLSQVSDKVNLNPVRVELPQISPDWSGITFNQMDSVTLPELQDIQSTDLLKDKEIKIVNANFEDDIPDLLIKSPAHPGRSNQWLIAIGIEKYKYVDNIIYAKRSAELFVKTLQKKAGISKQHTILLLDENASSGTIKAQIKILLEKVSPGDDVYFYYNGHGIPDTHQSNEPYLLPGDQYPYWIDEDKFFKLANIYKLFSDSVAHQVIFFIDSCFSDTLLGDTVAASRLVPKSVDFNEEKLVVLSASGKDQFSNAFAEKGHRLFSYYLMKSILSDQSLIKNIYNDVYQKVKKQSKQISGYHIQEPTLRGNKTFQL
ncbi:caspase family protein [Vibrio quintilis]|uniref:Caspase domain protein n=1 Tax=Vibrio quintilis TaxID=1117707 RepID=A0A1M7YRE2_9VIBR|nr:caspase family protein [Vibrio quintilis]SHO55207.1 Caspase domain protein [Vibrio quintilis]